MGKQTEEDKIIYRINKRFLKGIVDYGLISDGDKILVGLVRRKGLYGSS